MVLTMNASTVSKTATSSVMGYILEMRGAGRRDASSSLSLSAYQ